jgi:hypothetical protein
MPFTLAHAAAALPFRRTRLNMPALVVGCFAPDFEYFLRLGPHGSFGHRLAGLFLLDLPLGLIFLWVFHAYVQEPSLTLLPVGFQRRLNSRRHSLSLSGPVHLSLVLVSILMGAASHLLWDSFTHRTFWPYHHLKILSQRLSIAGSTVEVYKLLQHVSTLFGMLVLLIWVVRWYRKTTPDNQPIPAQRIKLAVTLIVVALVGAMVRAYVGVGMPTNTRATQAFIAECGITAITLVWFQLVVMGVIISRREPAVKLGART